VSTFIALLRAVNVGGTGKLAMADLKRLCETCGFLNVRTYIASGNVVFESADDAAKVKAAVETAVSAYTGKPVVVLLRGLDDLRAVMAGNPFAGHPGNKVMVVFLDAPPPDYWRDGIKGQADEEIVVGCDREFYIHYPEGQGRSKLSIAAAQAGTARNMNTVEALVALADKG
jgi:uncharacterized protein (DUF1697 family)